MDTLTVKQASGLLHLHPKRIQALARSGRLPAVRVGRRWLFPRHELERLMGSTGAPAAGRSVELSARNHLRGRIAHLHVDGLMAEVHVAIGDQQLVSVITRASAERMKLAIGDEVLAIVKSTEVMIGREERGG